MRFDCIFFRTIWNYQVRAHPRGCFLRHTSVSENVSGCVTCSPTDVKSRGKHPLGHTLIGGMQMCKHLHNSFLAYTDLPKNLCRSLSQSDAKAINSRHVTGCSRTKTVIKTSVLSEVFSSLAPLRFYPSGSVFLLGTASHMAAWLHIASCAPHSFYNIM